jgi:hypothetical protein
MHNANHKRSRNGDFWEIGSWLEDYARHYSSIPVTGERDGFSVTTESMTEQLERNKQTVQAFYDLMFNVLRPNR